MKSFSLIRTNPKLTTNIKLVVDSDYKLFLESFNTTSDLTLDRFKRFQFNKKNFYDELVPVFFKNVPASTAFSVRYSDDNDTMSTDYENQYDDIYLAGCDNIEDTYYDEEFECVAPLHIDRYNLPSNFVIFRVDGPGIIELNKDNFRTEILEKLKCITSFDLSKKTPIGEFLDRNYRNNDSFPETPFELDVREGEFSKWKGIEFESGGYSEKSLFLDDWMSKEKTFFDFEKFITDGYEENKVVYPNIINFKFLFDDTPADKTQLKKWSINRYFGFYMDSMYESESVSLYSPYELEKNLIISVDNICIDSNGNSLKPIVKDWYDDITYYIEYKGSFYRIERFIIDNETGYTYKIISDGDLSGEQGEFNKNIISIDDNNIISYNPDFNNSTFEVDGFEKADVWLIKIDSKFHVLRNINGAYTIQTDYGFMLNNNKLEYFINEADPLYTTTVDLNNVSDVEEPQKVFIYRLEFTDIKDFDTSIINTEWSNFDYDVENTISDSDEPKLYKVNLSDNSEPKQFDEFIYNNDLVNIPVSSEYISNCEIFRTLQNDTLLSDIWRKNSVFSKWGYQGSIANSDYVYKANNSLLGDDFNRVANTFEITPNRIERNLDYFYTVNADSNEYLSHSLHVTDYNDDFTQLNATFSFEFDKYLNVGTMSVGTMSSATYSGDYFNYFFSKKEASKNGEVISNSKKYSTFSYGDSVVSNSTLFKGIKFNAYKVSNLLFKDDGQIDKISVEPTSDLDEYKMSILFSSNNEKVTNDGIIDSSNYLEWIVLENWELTKQYYNGDYVVYYDVIFKANLDVLIEDSLDNPGLSSFWDIVTGGSSETALWGLSSPVANDWVYRFGEYYYYKLNISSLAFTFWIPWNTYTTGSKVIYKNAVYEAVSDNQGIQPISNKGRIDPSYWSLLTGSEPNRLWYIIEQWNSTSVYNVNDYAVHNDSLYLKETNTLSGNDNPELSSDWTFIHSIIPDSDRVYETTREGNNLITINGEYYWCVSNDNSDTLDNGIDIYINKKWKNVLINIYNNDNTLDKISNVNRDELYNSLYTNLTAKNFMDTINDLDNKYGFTDYLRYIVIEEDSSYNVYAYDNNLGELPYLIESQGPDALSIRTDSFKVNGVSPNKNLFKVNKVLKDSEINDISELNHYNKDKLGAEIVFNKDDIKIVENASGIRNINYIPIYRFSGDYMPVFQEVELFKRTGLNNDDLIGNYKFDTELTKFGIMEERIFSKVNNKDDILKFRNLDNYNSIYPMIDEFGYSYNDHFIFKSTWDKKYYISTENNI